MTLGKRMRELRESRRRNDGRKLRQEDVAEDLHVARTTVGMWEKDKRKPAPETLRQIATYYDVTLDYLLAEETSGRDPTSDEENDSELYKRIRGAWRPELTVKVPIIGIVRAGQPIFATQNIEGYQDVPASDVADAKPFFLRVKGDSMEPTIHEGSLVLIKMQPEVEHGQMALVLINGEEATIKRVFSANGQIILRADNPRYSPMLIPADEARIVGRVVQMTVKF